MPKEPRRSIVITIHDDQSAIVRLFDNEDTAFNYQCNCRLSNAKRIISGTTKKAWTLDTLAQGVAETYDIPRSQVRAAHNLTPF